MRGYLSRLILVVVAPLVALAVFLAVDHLRSEAAATDLATSGVAQDVAAALEQALQSRLQALELLGASPAFDAPVDDAVVRRQVQAFVDTYGSPLTVLDREGHVLLDARPEAPAARPTLEGALEAARGALRTARPQLSELAAGSTSGASAILLAVPLSRGGVVAGVLLTTFDDRDSAKVLRRAPIPEGWTLDLLDAQGRAVATTSGGTQAAAPAAAPGERASVAGTHWSVGASSVSATQVGPVERAGLSMLVALALATLAALLGGRVASALLERGVDSLARPGGAVDDQDAADDIREIAQARARLADAEREREAAQLALRRSERSYRLLFAAHPHPMWVFELDSLRFLEVNDAAVAGYGWSREEFLAMTVADLRRPEDRERLTQAVSDSRRLGSVRALPVGSWVHVCKDGSEREVEITWSDIEFHGRPARLALAIDVTERNQLQRRSREAHAEALRARDLLDQTLQRIEDGVLAVDRDWIFTFVNDSAVRVAGRSRRSADLVGQAVFDVLPELRGSALHEACLQSLANGQPSQVEQYLEPPGRWLGCRVFPSAEGLSVYFTDITEQRQAREALRTSERRYRLLFEANPNPMWVFDVETLRFLAVNDRAVKHYGYSRGEFLQMTIAQIRPPEDLPRLRDSLATHGAEAGPAVGAGGVWRHITRSGDLVDVEVSSSDIDWEGRPARLVLSHDVTERVRLSAQVAQALDASQRAERSLREVMDRIGDGVIALDRDRRYSYVNARAAELMGVGEPAALIGRALFETFPERRDSAFALALETALRTQQMIVLNDHYGPTDRWFEDRIYPSAEGVSIYFNDVTERRRAEALIRRSERQFRTLAEQMPAIVYRAGPLASGSMAYFSPHLATLGYAPQDWVRQPEAWLAAVHPEDRQALQSARAAAAKHRREMVLEYRVLDRAGRWRHFADYGRYVDDADGGEPVLQGVMVEITELKRAGQALRAAEATQRSLLEAMAEGVLVFDSANRILDANPAAAQMFGYGQDTLCSLGLADLLPAHERPRLGEVVSAMTNSDSQLLMEWERLRSDGSVFPAEASARAIGDGRFVEVLRDVTERRAAERALVAYQMELSELTQRLLTQERETNRRIAQALHDHLGQTLAVARLHLDATTVAHAGQIPELLHRECQRVSRALDQAIGDVRAVLGELRPPLLDDQGLLAALDNEIRIRASERADVDVLLEADDALMGRRWAPDVEYSAFMVAREAIVNAQRHAGATLVRVIVGGGINGLLLEIVDDGRGIPEPMRQGRPGHLGLVGMRERALAIGASFSIESAPDGGTRVRLRWGEATT